MRYIWLCVFSFIMGCAAQESSTSSGVTQCWVDPFTGECRCGSSPIVIDVAGDGIHLTSALDGVEFRLRPGKLERWAWTAPDSDDAWLVRPDADGIVHDGSHLFGDSEGTNGFAMLAKWDDPSRGGDSDGEITPLDAVWSQLRLWRDLDHDGVSTPSELTPLDVYGILGLGLVATVDRTVDQHGNQYGMLGHLRRMPGSAVSEDVYDMLLTQRQPNGVTTASVVNLYVCTAWTLAYKNRGGGSLSVYPCYETTVDPIVSIPDAYYQYRDVLRTAVWPDLITAATQARSDVLYAIGYATGMRCDPMSCACNRSTWEGAYDRAHLTGADPHGPPPYLSEADGIRTKCYAYPSGQSCGGITP